MFIVRCKARHFIFTVQISLLQNCRTCSLIMFIISFYLHLSFKISTKMMKSEHVTSSCLSLLYDVRCKARCFIFTVQIALLQNCRTCSFIMFIISFYLHLSFKISTKMMKSEHVTSSCLSLLHDFRCKARHFIFTVQIALLQNCRTCSFIMFIISFYLHLSFKISTKMMKSEHVTSSCLSLGAKQGRFIFTVQIALLQNCRTCSFIMSS